MPTIRSKVDTSREYVVELNRGDGDSVRKSKRYFERQGIEADLLPHKTTLNLIKPSGMRFARFKRIVARAVQPDIGSVVMFSRSTGNVFICNNRGNRPGALVLS